MEMDGSNLRSMFLVVFLMMSSSTTSTFPIAKPGCEDQDHCGNVSIPFPFGTREGCYLDKAFFIKCGNYSNEIDRPQAYLKNSTIMVKDISPEGQLRILYDVGYDCYYPNKTLSDYSGPWMQLSEPKVFNSTANTFIAIGCDTYATVEGTSKGRTYYTGCMSACYDREEVEDGPCSGIGCCQTSIPNGAREINITLDSYYNHSYVSDFNPCTYGFVIEEAAFKFFVDNLTNIDKNLSVPVVVDWVIAYETCEEAKKNLTSYACKTENSVCYDQNGALGYRCKCKEGFEGNPYLPTNGCQDVDECGILTLNNCANHSTCVNKLGSYTCKCNQGYHGDGRKDGEGCIADQKPDKKIYWPIVGVTIGSAIALALFLCLHTKLLRRKANKLREEFFKKNGGLILQQKLARQVGRTYSARIFAIEELQKATNDFAETQIIGRGGFGIVFKGELIDNKKVAIKKSRGVDQHQVEQFINEVIVLSQINNRNVVKLLGCCLETEVPLLVYEFLENGTLSEHLHNKIKASKLSWNIRLRIASEVAGVLSYLHSIASPPIIHRDIKSANILLDQNYTAKVADFGISRLVPVEENQVSTMVRGTHGYLDPEYLQTGQLTEKSDVYSFGIVLVELLTGKKVLASDRPQAELFLSNYFLSSLRKGNLVEVFDGSISCNENMEQLKEVAMIAKKCISVKGEDRPYMKDVGRELEALGSKAQQFVVQALEIDFTENEALIAMQSTGFDGNDNSIDLCSVCHTTTEQMSLPIYGGR